MLDARLRRLIRHKSTSTGSLRFSLCRESVSARAVRGTCENPPCLEKGPIRIEHSIRLLENLPAFQVVLFSGFGNINLSFLICGEHHSLREIATGLLYYPGNVFHILTVPSREDVKVVIA